MSLDRTDFPTLPGLDTQLTLPTEAATPTTPPPAPKPGTARPLLRLEKICGNCKASKDLSEFAIKNGTRRASMCRSCQKVHSDAHYQRNRQSVIEATAVRNIATRAKMVAVRDEYLEKHCVCEVCSSTVDLRLTARPEYTGPAVHEVLGGVLGLSRLKAAIEGSKILCGFCLGSHFGKIGGIRKKLIAGTAQP